MTYSTVLFDVNETLSDLDPLAQRFSDVGAPGSLARLWFASVLRDGFALTATGGHAAFADIGANLLPPLFASAGVTGDTGAVRHVMDGFSMLDLHDDVPEGIRNLSSAGFRLATLSNGAVEVARKLLGDAGLADEFDQLLSVEDAPVWKPGAPAYAYAAEACHVEPGNMVLVAVHPWDIHGAAQAGLGTAWINRTGAGYPAHFHAPDHTVSDLRELAGELGRGT